MAGEGAEAFAAFCLFRDMGPKRSMNGAFGLHLKAHGTAIESPRAPGTWRKWAKKYAWEARARAHDVENYQGIKKAREEGVKEAAVDDERQWQERRRQLREAEFQIAEQLLAKAKQMLAFPLVKKKTEEDGKTIIFEPAKWHFGHISQMTDIASKLSRLAAEMDTERPADNGGSTVEVKVLCGVKLSDV